MNIAADRVGHLKRIYGFSDLPEGRIVALDGAAVRRWREARAAGAPPPEEEGRGEGGARA